MEKVYIETNGCAVLRHETYKIAKYIEKNGLLEVESPDIADYIIMTGCAVIDENENYAIKAIKKLYEENKNHAKIIVAGCIPAIAGKKIKEISSDIIQIKNEEINRFDDIFKAKYKLSDTTFNINPKRHHSYGDPTVTISESEIKDLMFASSIDKISNSNLAIEKFNYVTKGRHLWREPDLFEIRVSYGCSGNCSYCATKLAIGDFKSIPEDIILKQAELAKKENYQKIMLMGDEIGAWREKDKDIVDLINDILRINPEFKIGIRYIQPDIIVKKYEKLKPILASGNIFYFCSAFQSGSERILKLMNRNPNIEPFIKCMEDIEKNNYPVLRHTQIIVGFPTETELDILKTLKALQRASFDHITISAYSTRENTEASKLEPLPKEIISERMTIFEDWLKLNRNNKLYQTLRDEFVNGNNKKLILKK